MIGRIRFVRIDGAARHACRHPGGGACGQAVGAHVVGCAFPRQVVHQPHHAHLGGAVVRLAEATEDAGHRGGEDDAPVVLVVQDRPGVPGDVRSAVQVHVDPSTFIQVIPCIESKRPIAGPAFGALAWNKRFVATRCRPRSPCRGDPGATLAVALPRKRLGAGSPRRDAARASLTSADRRPTVHPRCSLHVRAPAPGWKLAWKTRKQGYLPGTSTLRHYRNAETICSSYSLSRSTSPLAKPPNMISAMPASWNSPMRSTMY